jgi:hypothetical protein
MGKFRHHHHQLHHHRLILFLVVKLMNRMLQAEPATAPALTKQEMLLTEIRDLLSTISTRHLRASPQA